MRLPEYLCPFCGLSVTLVPEHEAREDLHRCSTCRRQVSLLPDGELAIPLPSGIAVRAAPDALEVALEGWFVTFGTANTALCFRVEPEEILWSKVPLLESIRFGAEWERLPRAPLRRFDWRPFESGVRGTNNHSVWSDLVFVAHDTSERRSGHTFPYAYDGLVVTTLLQWAHDVGVPRRGTAGGAYRGAPQTAPRPLRLVDERGRIVPLV